MKADGTDLRPLARHIGGHPEWESGRTPDRRCAARSRSSSTSSDQKVVGTLGTPETFPNPGGDIALSPDGKWFVNGHGDKGKNYYTILRRADGAWTRTAGFDQGGYITGELRIDPSPCWNRDGTQLAGRRHRRRPEKTRQMFVITVKRKGKP